MAAKKAAGYSMDMTNGLPLSHPVSWGITLAIHMVCWVVTYRATWGTLKKESNNGKLVFYL